MLHKIFIFITGAILSLALMTLSSADDKPKIGGLPWYTAMKSGLEEQSRILSWDSVMIGPKTTDPELQIEAIKDLIAQKVDAIGVVPNEGEALEAVLKEARDQHIIVITHESPEQKNVDWNFELASVKGFGEAHAKLLAEKMGGKGKYALFVGSLTVHLHNAWADAAIAYLKKHHPEMELVGKRYGVAENAGDSQQTTLDLISAHLDLKGVLTFGSQGPIGAGRAVKMRGKIGEIFVVGVFSPSQGIKLLKSDAVAGGFMWNPRQAGRVFVTIADDLKKGIVIKNDLEIEGLGIVYPKGTNLVVDQLVDINKTTIDGLARLGL